MKNIFTTNNILTLEGQQLYANHHTGSSLRLFLSQHNHPNSFKKRNHFFRYKFYNRTIIIDGISYAIHFSSIEKPVPLHTTSSYIYLTPHTTTLHLHNTQLTIRPIFQLIPSVLHITIKLVMLCFGRMMVAFCRVQPRHIFSVA